METKEPIAQDSKVLPLPEIFSDQVINGYNATEVTSNLEKKDVLQHDITRGSRSYAHFTLALIQIGLHFFLRLLRFSWRHKSLTIVIGLATLAGYGRFKVKEIQKENRIIHSNSVLHLKWSDIASSEYNEDNGNQNLLTLAWLIPGSGINFRRKRQLTAKEVAHAIYTAADDPRITGLTCDFTSLAEDNLQLGPLSFKRGLNMAILQEVVQAVTTFKEKKPRTAPVIAYANTMCQSCYYVATAFKEVYIQRHGEISLEGKSFHRFYYKKFLDNWNVSTLVYKGGEMKSLYDSYISNEMDNKTRESQVQLLNNLDQQYWHDVITSRESTFLEHESKRDKCLASSPNPLEPKVCPNASPTFELSERIKKAAKPGAIFGDEALELRMIDGYRYARQLEVSVKVIGEKLSLAGYHNRLQKAEDDTSTSQAATTKPLRKPIQKIKIAQQVKSTTRSQISNKLSIRIAEVNVYGSIIANEKLYSIVAELQCFAEDMSIKAILLRVDSPGGTFIASDTLAEAIDYAKSKKPIIVSIGGMAASGGYYVTVNASLIIANRASLLGSIGVISMVLDLSSLLQRFGITFESLNMGVPTTIFEQQTDLQIVAKEARTKYLYRKFVERVSESRNISIDVVKEYLAEGKMFTGEQAYYNGLIDEIGGLQYAKEAACNIASKQEKMERNEVNCDIVNKKCVLPTKNAFNLPFSL
jgi:protease IV